MVGSPKIGVVTPMFNNAGSIISAASSVQNQAKFYNDESYKVVHYIYDDASTDDSQCVVMKYILENDVSNIKMCHGTENKGQSFARNSLIKRALYEKCDIIAFLDADDEWYPDHLRLNVGGAMLHNCLVYSRPEFLSNGLRVFPVNIPVPKKFIGRQFEYNNFIWISSVVMDSKLLIGEEFDSDLNSVEDWDLWHRLYTKSHKTPINFIGNGTTTVKYNVSPGGQAGKSAIASKLLRKKHGFKLDGLKLNIACGQDYLPDFINADLYPTDKIVVDAQFDVAHIPYDDCSVDCIRSLHVIEHFNYYESAKVLNEWSRVLKPGGELIIETPDMLGSCKKYVEGNMNMRNRLHSHFFAFPWESGMVHLFLFSEDQLRIHLSNAGFTNIERIAPISNYVRDDIVDIFLAMKARKI